MPTQRIIYLGKLLRRAARVRGGGSALPGLIVERLEPSFLQAALGQLEYGVLLISGTNGKTTTTKMVTSLLQDAGYRVFTNQTGSNFTRGVVSSLLAAINTKGELPYDIAVLELDEAHAVQFSREVKPRFSLFLNVMRDQLDRFGEIDHTAKLLGQVAQETTEAIIINRDDPLVSRLAKEAGTQVKVNRFGASQEVLHVFPGDNPIRAGQRPGGQKPAGQPTGDVELASINGQRLAFRFDGQTYQAEVKLSGLYNFLNAAGALAAARVAAPAADSRRLVRTIEQIEPAFGRGEQGWYHQQPVEFVLVKNPSGFRLSLASAQQQTVDNEAAMIAINDHFADGRDTSWLWDVDFGSLRNSGVQTVSGIRAYDMALRLQYDNVPVRQVEPNLGKAFRQFIASNAGRPMRIYCTYTCMLQLRGMAVKKLGLERAL